jgi:hypothetical protein
LYVNRHPNSRPEPSEKTDDAAHVLDARDDQDLLDPDAQ